MSGDTDTWVAEYNTRRLHQSLDMAYPADRFHTPTAATTTALAEQLLPLRLPAAIAQALADAAPSSRDVEPPCSDIIIPGQRWSGDAVEFDPGRAGAL